VNATLPCPWNRGWHGKRLCRATTGDYRFCPAYCGLYPGRMTWERNSPRPGRKVMFGSFWFLCPWGRAGVFTFPHHPAAGQAAGFYALGVGRVFSRTTRCPSSSPDRVSMPLGSGGCFHLMRREILHAQAQVSMPLGSGGCFHGAGPPDVDGAAPVSMPLGSGGCFHHRLPVGRDDRDDVSMPLGSGGCFHPAARRSRSRPPGRFYALGVGRVFSLADADIELARIVRFLCPWGRAGVFTRTSPSPSQGPAVFLCPWGRAGVFTDRVLAAVPQVGGVSMPLGSGGCFHESRAAWEPVLDRVSMPLGSGGCFHGQAADAEDAR
jgi:hypothetical protein